MALGIWASFAREFCPRGAIARADRVLATPPAEAGRLGDDRSNQGVCEVRESQLKSVMTTVF